MSLDVAPGGSNGVYIRHHSLFEDTRDYDAASENGAVANYAIEARK
jgi:hypothetical protein